MQPPLPSPFYRVAVKALVFDGAGKLLLLQNHHGEWELPGGGWEHEETFEACVEREIFEELGIRLQAIGPIRFLYRGYNARHGYTALRIAVPVELESHEFVVGEDMQQAAFFARKKFMDLDLMAAEGDVQKFADLIWPAD